jgi:hypothetical protein
MPFTFAHPAAVFPFRYLPPKYYSWAGLIIGSMVPDFQAFVSLGGDKLLSHSWMGIYTYDLPLGLFLLLLFHYVVRNALIAHLPAFLRERFSVYTRIKNERYFTKRYLPIIVSLLIGIYTHIIWDRLTHTTTFYYVDRLGLELPGEKRLEIQTLLQWGSSLLGIILLSWQIKLMPVVKDFLLPFSYLYWITIAMITSIVYFIRTQFPYEYGGEINIVLGGLMLGVVIASSLYNLRQYHTPIIPRRLPQ